MKRHRNVGGVPEYYQRTKEGRFIREDSRRQRGERKIHAIQGAPPPPPLINKLELPAEAFKPCGAKKKRAGCQREAAQGCVHSFPNQQAAAAKQREAPHRAAHAARWSSDSAASWRSFTSSFSIFRVARRDCSCWNLRLSSPFTGG